MTTASPSTPAAITVADLAILLKSFQDALARPETQEALKNVQTFCRNITERMENIKKGVAHYRTTHADFYRAMAAFLTTPVMTVEDFQQGLNFELVPHTIPFTSRLPSPDCFQWTRGIECRLVFCKEDLPATVNSGAM